MNAIRPRHATRNHLFMLAFFALTALSFGLEKQIEAQQPVEIDYN